MWKSRCQTYLLENHIDALKAKKMHTPTHPHTHTHTHTHTHIYIYIYYTR